MLHHNHTDERFAAAHADVDALLQRLGRDVTTLQDGDDPVNRQALADAGERFETAESQLGKAQSVAELLVARAITVEGLESTRAVRTRQGLDPGHDPAPAPAVDAAPEVHHSWIDALTSSRGGLGSTLGAGAAGGILGLLGGAVLGGAIGGGDFGGGDFGGGDFGE